MYSVEWRRRTRGRSWLWRGEGWPGLGHSRDWWRSRGELLRPGVNGLKTFPTVRLASRITRHTVLQHIALSHREEGGGERTGDHK